MVAYTDHPENVQLSSSRQTTIHREVLQRYIDKTLNLFKTEPLIFNPKLTHPKAFPTSVSASCFLRTSLTTRLFFTLVLSHPTSAHQQSQLGKAPRTAPPLPARGATGSTSPRPRAHLSLVSRFHSCPCGLFAIQWPEGSSRPPADHGTRLVKALCRLLFSE